MTMLAIDWGYALLVTGMGIGTVFVLLIVLIGLIDLQTRVIQAFICSGSKATVQKSPAADVTETHPTPQEKAAIAMAMHLYFNAHDEEPHIITIEEVERRYSPWSSKIYNMRNTTIK